MGQKFIEFLLNSGKPAVEKKRFHVIHIIDLKSPSEKFEQELAEDLNKLTADQLEQFMASKDRLNLFDQTSSEWKRKSGRIFKVD